MSKVTSKLPDNQSKILADRFRAWRLRIFDQTTKRQRARETARLLKLAAERGWKREDLYSRGGPR